MVPFTTPVQCQSPRAHLVYARTPPLCKRTDVKRGTTANTQIWLQQMELVETPLKIPRNDSTKLVIASLCMCWSQRASLCTWLFSPGRQSASHECYFLKVAQLLMVDTCGDMETMMDPLRNEAITHGSPSKIARSTLQKSQKIWDFKQDSSPRWRSICPHEV